MKKMTLLPMGLPLLAALGLAACSAAPSAQAAGEAVATAEPATATACALHLQDAWARMPPGGMPMHGGFVRIGNPCDRTATITGASSRSYGSVEMHETRIENGVSRKRKVPSLVVPARGEIVLAPGGLHLMLMQPAADLAPGGTVEVTFELDDGSRVPARFELRGPAG